MHCAAGGIRFRCLATTSPKDLSKVIKSLLRSAADRFQGMFRNAVQYTLAMKLKPCAAKNLAGVASNHSFSTEEMDRESGRHCVALLARLALTRCSVLRWNEWQYSDTISTFSNSNQ